MKFSTTFLVLVAATLPALAVPTAEPEATDLVGRVAEPAELEKRDNTIYVCEGTYVSLISP